MQKHTISTHWLILILTFGVFGIINTEMGVVGSIPQIAERFSVSVPTAGWTVSIFALIVSFAAPILPMAFSGANRRNVMLVTLSAFALSNLISLWTSSFWLLLLARALPAFFHPIYVAMAFTLAAQTEKEDPSKGIAKIFIGVSAGMVLGVPLTTFITTHLSFEWAMGLFAAINLLTLVATYFFIPSIPTKRSSFGSQVKVLRSRLLWYSVIAFTLLNGAMFGFFSFMSDFLNQVSGLSFDLVGSILLVYGVANIFGNMLAGRYFGKHKKSAILFLVPMMLIAYGFLFVSGAKPWICVTLVLCLGILAGFASIVGQYLISSAAHNAPDFANGLFLSSANFGTAFGTFLCGLFMNLGDTRFALLGTFLMLILCIVFIILRIKQTPAQQL